MHSLNPLVVRMRGANISRRMVENVWTADLKIENVEATGIGGIVKLIVARVD